MNQTTFDPELRPRLLSREEITRITERIQSETSNDDAITVYVMSWWYAGQRWARNTAHLAGDITDRVILIQRTIGGRRGGAVTNQSDDASILGMIRTAGIRCDLEAQRKYPDEMVLSRPVLEAPKATLWSDATYQERAEDRSRIVLELIEKSEAQGMVSSGYIEARACIQAELAETGTIRFQEYTQAQCSATVRHPQGEGSGWAGLSSFDWQAIDPSRIANQALEKCIASIRPVRIEPGRYTTIMEPQAVSDMLEGLMRTFPRRVRGGGQYSAETGRGPFALEFDRALGVWRSKLDLKVIDERLSISHDPVDPELGVATQPGMEPINWITNGVLTALEQGYDTWRAREDYALPELNENIPTLHREAYRMSGGNTSREEMIASTKRGVLVTRFDQLVLVHPSSVLFTGYTRDGLWLVENGKIVKPVKNMRILESPLFMLNQVDQIGPAVPVFRRFPGGHWATMMMGLRPAIVPTLKVRDFSFVATSDAI